ncbi:MAG: Transcriptional regulator, TrmB [Parcubacteria bacterium C7867-007]|nr:MAG: Transcriptional regulator, TrmB [Parcubacteria bacterium C7867-007]
MSTAGSDKSTQNLLEEVGLTETEAHLYRYGIQHDAVTVQELGKETGIKRPTIYHALHTLTEKGLVTEQHRTGKIHFHMEPPARLLGWLDRQREEFAQKEDGVQKLIAELATHTPSSTQDIVVTSYAGTKNMQTMFDLALYPRSKECYILATSSEFLKRFDADGSRVSDAKQRGVNVHVQTKKDAAASLVIFDDTTALFMNDSVTTIVSPSLAKTIASLF